MHSLIINPRLNPLVCYYLNPCGISLRGRQAGQYMHDIMASATNILTAVLVLGAIMFGIRLTVLRYRRSFAPSAAEYNGMSVV